MNVRLWIVVALLSGLLLRIVAASAGDLWLDEAWSAYLAEQAGPAGVFVRIHHDNNHVLNSFWLALVGPTAPLLVQRLLSVAAGTATILVAARLGLRRSPMFAVVLAWLFALSPMLVQFSSEARGYAPAILFLLLFLDLVDRHRRESYDPGRRLAAVAALGTLSHFVMVPAMASIAVWHLLAGGGRRGWRPALALFGAPAFYSALMLAIVLGSAQLSGGLQVGGTQPFSWHALGRGLAEAAGLATGLASYGSTGLLTGLATAFLLGLSLLVPPHPRPTLVLLGAILGLGLPIAAAILQPPNVGFARYHVLTGLTLLLLLGWRLATLRQRSLAALLTGAVAAAMLHQDWEIARRARGDPGQPIDIAQKLQPGGATILLASPRGKAILDLAARRRSYALRLVGPACAPADFLATELDPGSPVPERFTYCGQPWRMLASQTAPSPGQVGWLIARADRVASR